MRRIIIAAAAALGVLVPALAGGWWAYTHLFRDPLDVARQLVAKGELPAAALELRRAVQRNPGNAVAAARLGMLQLVLGDPVAAEHELKAARAGGYPGTDALAPLARAILLQGRPREVLAYSPEGLPPPQAAALLTVRGRAQLALGDAESARGSAEAAERLAPKLAEAPLLAARVALAQGQAGWALQRLDQALQISPDFAEALLLKAELLRIEGDPAALGVLDAAVAAAPDATGARLARAGALLASGADGRAAADVAAVLARVPKQPLATYLKALLAVRARDWAGADATLQAIQPLLPRLPRGEYTLALIKSNLGQTAQAADAVERYLAHAATDADGWRLLARIDLLANRRAEAAAALARLGTPAPERAAGQPGGLSLPGALLLPGGQEEATPQALTRLAASALGAGDTAGAERELERSLEIRPLPADLAAVAVVAALRAGDPERAATALEALRQRPIDPERLARLEGAVRLAELDFTGARDAFAAGLKTAPESLALKLGLARVLALQDQPAAAEALLAPALAKSPANPLVLETLVELHVAAGHADRAAAALAAARAAEPDNPALLVAQAVLAARTGNPAAALATLEEAPAAAARTPQLRALRAGLLLAQQKPAAAIELYRRMLQDAPGDLAVRRELIELLAAQGQGAAAVDLARQGLKDAPGNAVLLQAYAGATWRAQGLEAALSLAEKLRRDPANLPVARLLKSAVYLAAGRPADAAAAAAAERAEAPFGALIRAEALALRAAGQAAAARARLSDWTAAAPDPAASEMLGGLALEAKQPDEAERAFTAVLAVRPRDVVALNNLAWLYQQKHDARALDLARRGYLLAPGGQTADTLGWILVQQGGEPGAATGLLLLRQAAAMLPQDRSVQYHLAAALRGAGQLDQARALLTAILAPPAQFEEAEQARQLQATLAAGHAR
jgi:putative PEP-CTERM system TPR-repeat lipoprotein